GQPLRIVKWKRTQQQCVDDAEAPCCRADANSERSDHEDSVKRMARPKPERIPSILKHFADRVNWDGDKQGRQRKKEPGNSPSPTRFIQLVTKSLFERIGVGFMKRYVKPDQPSVKSN